MEKRLSELGTAGGETESAVEDSVVPPSDPAVPRYLLALESLRRVQAEVLEKAEELNKKADAQVTRKTSYPRMAAVRPK